MVYALGIVAIGVRPIQREYGSVWKFLKVKSSEMNIQNPFPGILEKLQKTDGEKPSASSGASTPNSKSMDTVSDAERSQFTKVIESLY